MSTHHLMLLVLLLGLAKGKLSSSSLLDFRHELHDQDNPEQEDFLQKLMQNVLGIEHAPHKIRHPNPPQYMLDLYNAVAGTGGLTLTPNPYHANVVRSYLDKDSSHSLRFFFNVSSSVQAKKDRLLEAEFHLYKLKPRLRAKDKAKLLKSQLLEVRVYQVTYKGHKKKKEFSGHRLLDSRRMSIHSTGWEVFYVKAAVSDWTRDNTSNLGFLVSVRSLENEMVPNGLVRFAKQRHRLANKHPLLVLFVDDGRHSTKRYFPQTDYHSYGYQDSGSENATSEESDTKEESTRASQQRSMESSWRKQRAVGHSSKDNHPVQRQSCTRHDLYVDFEKIGWSAWIISPKGYNAFYCKGECTFPLDQNQWPTNHATVQSIVNELKLTPGVGTPCCVPNKLYSISLLYFDEHENVILKQYDDMVASSCGCH